MQQWRMLIEMRLKEYRGDYLYLEQNSQDLDTFKKGEEDLKFAWMRIMTIVIDCCDHIQRGKLSEGDPLLPYLQKFTIAFDSALSHKLHRVGFNPIGEA